MSDDTKAPQPVDWTSDEAVVRAAVPDVQFWHNEKGDIWLAGKGILAESNSNYGGGLSDLWPIARHHPTVQAYERANSPSPAYVTLSASEPAPQEERQRFEDWWADNGDKHVKHWRKFAAEAAWYARAALDAGQAAVPVAPRTEGKEASGDAPSFQKWTPEREATMLAKAAANLEHPQSDAEAIANIAATLESETPPSGDAVELPPLDEKTMRGPAWQALYDRFNQLPVPEERVWEIQADLTNALTEIRQLRASENTDRCDVCAGSGKLLTGAFCMLCKGSGNGYEEKIGLRIQCDEYESALEAAKKENAELRAKLEASPSPWRSVEDELPPDSSNVAVFSDGAVRCGWLQFSQPREWRVYYLDGAAAAPVSHWKPLDSPPAIESAKQAAPTEPTKEPQ